MTRYETLTPEQMTPEQRKAWIEANPPQPQR